MTDCPSPAQRRASTAPSAPRPWSCAVAVALAALALAAPLHAQGLYKWVDAEGKVTYSDQPPPPSGRVEKMIPRAPEADGEAARELARRDAEFRTRKQTEAEKSAKAADQAAVEASRREACDQLNGQLRALRSGAIAVRYDAKGERVVMNPEQTRREIEDAEKLIAQRCR